MGDQVRLHIEQLGLEVTVRQVGPASAGPLASGSAAPASGEAVERIAGGIAHELNNVLTAIAGYNELILGKMSESNPLRRGDRARSPATCSRSPVGRSSSCACST